ncbi:MAG: hypothetical protein KUG77_15280 [Nannocystaceae bacterium]|nr:hypothetical protein [Nannocystaceae bacterium]
MAHIAVHLQRTPQGLHPASAVALCWARDIGSARGATVTGLCIGDAGQADQNMVTAASRFGADVLLFGGPNGLRNLCERLNPVHVLVPFTPPGLAVAAQLERGPTMPRWVDRRSPPYATADAITAVVAGVKPWHAFNRELDPEFEGDVDAAPLPPFLRKSEQGSELPSPPVFDLGAAPLGYVAPPSLDPVIETALRQLDATPTSLADAPHQRGGTTIILNNPQSPQALVARADLGRVLLLAGPPSDEPTDVIPTAWKHADWVLQGRWADVVASLREGPWSQAPA